MTDEEFEPTQEDPTNRQKLGGGCMTDETKRSYTYMFPSVDTVFQKKFDALVKKAMDAVYAWRCPHCAGPGTIDFPPGGYPYHYQYDEPCVTIICKQRCQK